MADAKPLPQAKLIDRVDLTPELAIFHIQPDADGPLGRKDGKWGFTPGQFLTLGLPGPEKQIERAFSIASSPYDDTIELYVEHVPKGQFTTMLWGLKPGETLSCRKPAGRFTLNANTPFHLQVCTVTGLAPFLSVLKTYGRELKDGKAPQDRRFLLLYAASFAQELGYLELLREMAKEPWLTFVPTVSRPAESLGWEGETGRCEDIVRKHADLHGFIPERTTAYLCGNGDMIRNVEGILKRARFAPEALKKEEYW